MLLPPSPAPLSLMDVATRGWRAYAESYRPTPVETFLSQELGVWPQGVMDICLQQPGLASLCLTTQVRPAIRALKAANLEPQDIWFLVSKRRHLLSLR